MLCVGFARTQLRSDTLLNADRRLVFRRRALAVGKELPRLHPAMGSLEGVAGVRLEDEPLAWPESSQLAHLMVFHGQLFQKVLLVALGLEVDIPLRPLQGTEIALDVLAVGIVAEQE